MKGYRKEDINITDLLHLPVLYMIVYHKCGEEDGEDIPNRINTDTGSNTGE